MQLEVENSLLDQEYLNSEKYSKIKPEISSIAGWFTVNQGQIDDLDVKFVYGTSDISIGFIESGYLIKITNKENLTSVVKVIFERANRVTPEGRKELQHVGNYFMGNDSSKWKRNVTNFHEVEYENIYNGIDLIFYSNEEGLKYDFIVQPDADPNDIRIIYENANDISIDINGNLKIWTPSGKVTDGAPRCYQRNENYTEEIISCFVVVGNNVQFHVEAYDITKALIIDPILYSTFIGGSEYDDARTLTIDSENSLYLASHTRSSDFPTTSGCYDSTHNGDTDTVVYKFNQDLTELMYSTYIGGSGRDAVRGFDVDEDGCAYISVLTESEDYPTTPGCFDETFDGSEDGAIVKISTDGSELIYSTYIGGGDTDSSWGISVDNQGFSYVTGTTNSSDFPTTSGCYKEYHTGGSRVCFISKMNKDGSDLEYSTFLGGTECYGIDLVIDDDKNVYVAGVASSPDFPTTPGCYDYTFNGAQDGFLSKLSLNGEGIRDLKYSTYIGGVGAENLINIKIDNANDVYATGYTNSVNFPTTLDSFDPIYNGGAFDIIFFKISMRNNGPFDLIYSSFLGGISTDEGFSIDVDSSHNVYITGTTMSSDFQTTNGCFDDSYDGISRDAFISKVSSDGSELIYSSFINGGGREQGYGIVANDINVAFLTIYAGPYFPVSPGSYDTTHNGGRDDIGFIKFELTTRNIKPKVYNISYSNHSVVNKTIYLSGKTWDPNNPITIESVEISVDKGNWITMNGTYEWNHEWNTSAVENGEHTLRFRAYDGEHYSDEVTITVIVNNKDDSDKSEDGWYEEPFYLGGLVAAIIFVVVIAVISIRKRNEQYYDDWGEEDFYDEE